LVVLVVVMNVLCMVVNPGVEMEQYTADLLPVTSAEKWHVLKRQPFWYHPRVARLSETGHSQWPPHRLGMPCRNTFGMRLLFPSFAEN